MKPNPTSMEKNSKYKGEKSGFRLANKSSHSRKNKSGKVSHFINSLSDFLRPTFRIRNANSLKESLEEVIEEHNANGFEMDLEERELLHNVLTFSELDVEDVMIPRADIVAVNNDISLDELKKVFVQKAHTRLPVYRRSLDNITGFIRVKDFVSVLASDKAFDMETIVRQILFVPPSMKVSDLLVKMQISHVHMAIVVDEYGGTNGIVTLEDLMEEIVGEIEDEHDIEEATPFTQLEKNLFEVSARIDIERLEEKLGVDLSKLREDEDFDTVGGLIFCLLGRVPAIGEVAEIPSLGLEFEIKEADARRIRRVLIRKKT